MNELPKLFEIYLTSNLKLTATTVRNYKADLAHFLRWASLQLAANNITDCFYPRAVADYKTDQIKTKTAPSTLNRRLSTLRAFCRFLVVNGFLAGNPAENISNIDIKETQPDRVKEKLLQEFTKHLQNQKISATTLKNYLSDVRQFLAWHVQAKQQ